MFQHLVFFQFKIGPFININIKECNFNKINFGCEFNGWVIVVKGGNEFLEFNNRVWPEDENIIYVTFVVQWLNEGRGEDCLLQFAHENVCICWS